MPKIFSWNVNSVNARLENVIQLVKEYSPAILLFQEIKCQDHNFPRDVFEDLGYNVATNGQKSYNGVAIVSRYRLYDIETKSFKGFEDDARYIEATVDINGKCLRIASIYVPNGQAVKSEKFPRKLSYIDDLNCYLKSVPNDQYFIIGGDFNVAPNEIDLHDPIGLRNHLGFHSEERVRIKEILNGDFKDSFRYLYPNKRVFTWWDYRDRYSFSGDRGWRLDYILTNKPNTIEEAGIVADARQWNRPSDHAPVFCKITI